MKKIGTLGLIFAVLVVGLSHGVAAKPVAPLTPLSEDGEKLLVNYSAQLQALRAEIAKSLPKVNEQKQASVQQLRDAVQAAQAQANSAQKELGKIQTAKALVEHAKGKWIGGANKGIAQAEAMLKKATTPAAREAAEKELAKWQANKEDGIKALQERQAAWDKAKRDEPQLTQAYKAAQEALSQARANELTAVQSLLKDLTPLLNSDQLDALLCKCAVLAHATPRGLAEFAQLGQAQQSLVGQLLSDTTLMKQMLIAGGARAGKYGRAMQIYTAIQQASPRAKEGLLQRLALGVSLEHAVAVKQSNPQTATNAPEMIDPVQRYLHYERAYLDGELDPAFQNFSAWEYRMVVDCDAPDEMLAWGREMLRNYRPDHIYNPDYGWRYTASVKTEVPYGSDNVKYDLPSLHNYQNIIKDGGICGRRAFFGRFIAQSFGIPTWGVTQYKHAAVGHWTPKGWVVNLGAGFQHSWWDKDDAPRSGTDFLLETQARQHQQDYLKILRTHWISYALGEQAYNDRKAIAGGFWSSMAHYQTVLLASTAVTLGPLGQELAEANEPQETNQAPRTAVAEVDRKIVVDRDGSITVPAVAFRKSSGRYITMKSFAGGMQLHATGGFKAEYAVEVLQAGKYLLSFRVVTVQEGQKVLLSANNVQESKEIAVPYTLGSWEQTQPVELSLSQGMNVLHFSLKDGSRGVTIKYLTLQPVK